MNTRRSLPRFLIGSFAAVTLLVTSTFASISHEELAALLAKAEGGSGIAQYNLGLVYANQQEPVANIVEAYAWLNLAADNGATGKALMLVSSQMTPEQISQGKQLLEERRANLTAHRTTALGASSPKTPEPVKTLSDASNSPIVAAQPVATPVVAASTDSDSATLQAALKRSSDDLAAAWKENEQLKAQIAKASQDATILEQLKKERDQLTATVEANTNEISTMRAAAANFEGERNALQQKIAVASQQGKDSVATELATTKTNLKNAESELAKAATVAAELGTTRETLATLNGQLQKLTAENQRLASLVKQAETTADEKNASTEKRLTEINGELMTAQAKLADATAKAAAGSNASAELSTVRQQNTELTAQLQNIGAGKNQAAKAASDAQQQLGELSSKLKAAEETASAASAERNGLAAQVASLKAAADKPNSAAQVQIAELTSRLETAQRQAADQRETLSVRVKTAEDALAQATTERNDLAQKLATAKPSKKEKAAQTKIEELTAELESARAAATKKSQDGGAELTVAKAEIADLQSKLKSSDEALAAAKAAPAAEPQTVAVATASETGTPVATVPTTENQPDVQKELAESQMKLSASLRSYQLQQNEVDRLEKALASIDEERAQLAEKLQNATTESSKASAKAAVNNDAAAQLAGIREQLRQTQNQLASIAYENSELKHRIAFLSPSAVALTPLNASTPTPSVSTPNRPGTAATPSSTSTVTTASAPEPRTHTVAAGETLSTISKRYYGSANRWTQILEANRAAISNPSALKVGTKLKIP